MLERMTRDIRQANWIYFYSSQIVDVDTLRSKMPIPRAYLLNPTHRSPSLSQSLT